MASASTQSATTVNGAYFDGKDAVGYYLEARGFSASGDRTGGIIRPQIVDIAPGSILVRLYHLENRKFGGWWTTPYELARIYDYFGRDGTAAATGRSEGKGILHASFAVRHDWSRANAGDPSEPLSPSHLGRFVCVSTVRPLKAYYGEGDDAPSGDKRSIQKAIRIVDKAGAQTLVRQIFLPQCWTYQSALSVVEDDWTDSGLINTVRQRNRGPLGFEI